MKIAPLADVKARLSAYVEACRTEGPVVITRNGKAVALLLAPLDDEDLESLRLSRSARQWRPKVLQKPRSPRSSRIRITRKNPETSFPITWALSRTPSVRSRNCSNLRTRRFSLSAPLSL